MALRRNGPLLAAATIGIAAGYYAFNQPLKQYSDDQKSGSKDFRSSDSKGQSQTATSTDTGSKGAASTQPHPSLAYGGTSAVDPTAPTVAGTTESGRRGNSADPNPSLRSASDAKKQDGSGGGGVGVAEMKERKAEGKGMSGVAKRPYAGEA